MTKPAGHTRTPYHYTDSERPTHQSFDDPVRWRPPCSRSPKQTTQSPFDPRRTTRSPTDPERTTRSPSDPERTTRSPIDPKRTTRSPIDPKRTTRSSTNPERTTQSSIDPERTTQPIAAPHAKQTSGLVVDCHERNKTRPYRLNQQTPPPNTLRKAQFEHFIVFFVFVASVPVIALFYSIYK